MSPFRQALESALAHLEKSVETRDWCELQPVEAAALLGEIERMNEAYKTWVGGPLEGRRNVHKGADG